MNQTITYRYSWRGDERGIQARRKGDTVTCTDPDTGEALGIYTLSGDTLVGEGSVSDTRRKAIVAELRRCEPPLWAQPENGP